MAAFVRLDALYLKLELLPISTKGIGQPIM